MGQIFYPNTFIYTRKLKHKSNILLLISGKFRTSTYSVKFQLQFESKNQPWIHL